MTQSTWQTRSQLIAVLVIFWLYLVLGAIIFTTIERHHAVDLQAQFLSASIDFVRNNTCVSRADLQSYSNVLIDVYSGGLRWTAQEGFNSSKSNNWDLVDSLFFSATVVTTIGYGHLAPSTPLGRSVCLIYALFGIPLSGLLVTIIGQQLKNRLRGLWKRLLARTRCIASAESSWGRYVALVTAIIIVGAVFYVLLIIIPACFFNYLEGWDWLTSQYYAFISFTTIGFGDYVAGDSPNLSLVGRIAYKVVLIFYLVFGMGFVTMLLQGMQKKNAQKMRRFTEKKVIRRILKKRRVRRGGNKDSGMKGDMVDGDGSMMSKETPLSESEEYVVIIKNIVITGDSQVDDDFEMNDIESGVDIETVSVVDDVVQTQTVSYCDAITQTVCPAKTTSSVCSYCHCEMRPTVEADVTDISSSQSQTSLRAPLAEAEEAWKLTENSLCPETEENS